MRAHIRHLGGVQFEVEARGHRIVCDQTLELKELNGMSAFNSRRSRFHAAPPEMASTGKLRTPEAREAYLRNAVVVSVVPLLK